MTETHAGGALTEEKPAFLSSALGPAREGATGKPRVLIEGHGKR